MKINITGRVAGYSYAEGEQDIPKEHAQIFLDAGKANVLEPKSSSDFTISELREMDLSDKDESFFEGDERASIDQFK